MADVLNAQEVRLAGAVNDSIVDGPGFRLAFFVQGCTHHCPGCQNPETHNPEGGFSRSIAECVEAWRANPLLDGVTLSGGEPLDQAQALGELARIAHEDGLNVWCYTGYLYEEILEGVPSAAARQLLDHVDVLVDGPFLQDQRSLDLKWCGSANQRLINVPASLAAGDVVLLEE